VFDWRGGRGGREEARGNQAVPQVMHKLLAVLDGLPTTQWQEKYESRFLSAVLSLGATYTDISPSHGNFNRHRSTFLDQLSTIGIDDPNRYDFDAEDLAASKNRVLTQFLEYLSGFESMSDRINFLQLSDRILDTTLALEDSLRDYQLIHELLYLGKSFAQLNPTTTGGEFLGAIWQIQAEDQGAIAQASSGLLSFLSLSSNLGWQDEWYWEQMRSRQNQLPRQRLAYGQRLLAALKQIQDMPDSAL
jgi:hypothetical protein